MSRIHFLWNYIKHPRQVGSVTPSSRWLCRRLLSGADIKRCECIVEFGPGTASLTREILAVLPRSARLLIFEINEDFIRLLRKEFRQPNCIVINDSAERLQEHLEKNGLDGADYIFSGLPFTTMPALLRYRILHVANNALKKNGKFIAYQYSTYMLKYLRRIFGKVRVSMEPRNIPPAFCFVCSKRNNASATERTENTEKKIEQ